MSRNVVAKLNRPFIRFLLVGAFNTLVGLSIIALCMNVLRLGYWPSTLIGNSCGAVVSYVLNRRFTFRSNASVSRSLWKFFAVIGVCYFISYGAGLYAGMLVSAAIPSFPQAWEHDIAALAGTGIYTITNYWGHKRFTFRTAARSSLDESR